MHNLVLLQNLLKEMEKIKRIIKSTEQKFEELEMALQSILGKTMEIIIIFRVSRYYYRF